MIFQQVFSDKYNGSFVSVPSFFALHLAPPYLLQIVCCAFTSPSLDFLYKTKQISHPVILHHMQTSDLFHKSSFFYSAMLYLRSPFHLFPH